ncbi:MAG: transcriptional regulator [Rubritepida sp.]|nr:transcriptional regulator [Rubritepida sp.]
MLSKVAAILKSFRDKREVSVTGIAGQLAIPKSSASRLMKDMAASGFLEQHPITRQFRPGPVFLAVQRQHSDSLDLLEDAAAELALLRDRFGHTCFLIGIEGTTLRLERTLEGSGPIRVHATPRFMGGVAFYRAPGRALLARRSDAEVRALYPRTLRSAAAEAPASLEELLDRLAVVRRQGYAETSNEGFPNVAGIAVAVEAPGEPPLALNVCFVAGLVDKAERLVIAEALLLSGRRLGQRFGDPAWAMSEPGLRRESSP